MAKEPKNYNGDNWFQKLFINEAKAALEAENSGGVVGPIEGTAIPVGEAVDKIYFNTNLSVEETNAYLSQLTYVDIGLGAPAYLICIGEHYEALKNLVDGVIGLAVMKNTDEHYTIKIFAGSSFDSFSDVSIYNNCWLSADERITSAETTIYLTLPYSGAFMSLTNSISDFNGIPVGAENEKIKNVLSITPFTAVVEGGGELYEVDSVEELPQNAPDGSLALVEVEGGTGGDGVVVCNDETIHHQTAIKELVCPNATSIGVNAFPGCIALTSINFPNATSIGANAFSECRALTSINFPNATSISEHAFYECRALTSVDLPNATSIGEGAFYRCTALASVDLPNATSIGVHAFYGCTSLEALIISNTETVCNASIVSLGNTKILNAEGMPTGEGFIYVPTAFYEQYVANLVAQVVAGGYDEATATYLVTSVLRKIEDYPEICGEIA